MPCWWLLYTAVILMEIYFSKFLRISVHQPLLIHANLINNQKNPYEVLSPLISLNEFNWFFITHLVLASSSLSHKVQQNSPSSMPTPCKSTHFSRLGGDLCVRQLVSTLTVVKNIVTRSWGFPPSDGSGRGAREEQAKEGILTPDRVTWHPAEY